MDVYNVHVLNSPCQSFLVLFFLITTLMQACIFSNNKVYDV